MADTELNKSTLRSRRHRELTGNAYDRAYASASRRAVRLFRTDNPDLWNAIIDQELIKLRRAPTPDA